jgi:hypothetical protein
MGIFNPLNPPILGGLSRLGDTPKPLSGSCLPRGRLNLFFGSLIRFESESS